MGKCYYIGILVRVPPRARAAQARRGGARGLAVVHPERGCGEWALDERSVDAPRGRGGGQIRGSTRLLGVATKVVQPGVNY